ncbi:hypothetical protein B0T17DRAFT_506778 [Bombardia bombarda]|uniref:Uncharacterized protein n=1 Tax=Bombardia bombarda TaxID=252184 RepID=A0AA40C9M4_9PEZI|nr:hypothetical protein B0T17DRAFT_506778 [Bombardia bombarda]
MDGRVVVLCDGRIRRAKRAEKGATAEKYHDCEFFHPHKQTAAWRQHGSGSAAGVRLGGRGFCLRPAIEQSYFTILCFFWYLAVLRNQPPADNLPPQLRTQMCCQANPWNVEGRRRTYFVSSLHPLPFEKKERNKTCMCCMLHDRTSMGQSTEKKPWRSARIQTFRAAPSNAEPMRRRGTPRPTKLGINGAALCHDRRRPDLLPCEKEKPPVVLVPLTHRVPYPDSQSAACMRPSHRCIDVVNPYTTETRDTANTTGSQKTFNQPGDAVYRPPTKGQRGSKPSRTVSILAWGRRPKARASCLDYLATTSYIALTHFYRITSVKRWECNRPSAECGAFLNRVGDGLVGAILPSHTYPEPSSPSSPSSRLVEAGAIRTSFHPPSNYTRAVLDQKWVELYGWCHGQDSGALLGPLLAPSGLTDSGCLGAFYVLVKLEV